METNRVAALFVARGGSYWNLPGVDAWDELRDARKYNGPLPVVAHPPCSRWCRLAGLVEARWGHKKGDDGGCFGAALLAVRRWGGVLEHPAYSAAWPAFGIKAPPTGHRGWVDAEDGYGGHVAYVEQIRYGHPAKKATWLYARFVKLPELRWGSVPNGSGAALVSWCGNRVRTGEVRPRLGKKAASATPKEFRDVLIGMALTAPTAPPPPEPAPDAPAEGENRAQ